MTVDVEKARALVNDKPTSLDDDLYAWASNAADLIAALLDERDALARDAAYWKEEARRYCANADFWRSKFEVAAMKGASNES